jgi:hypothetical protein
MLTDTNVMGCELVTAAKGLLLDNTSSIVIPHRDAINDARANKFNDRRVKDNDIHCRI